jgi:hypothetical protein
MIDNLIKEKYGEQICSELVNDFQIIAQNIREKNEENQLKVKKHLAKINDQLDLKLDINNTNWAFDFSGWTGKLHNVNDHLKKYMIIGLEPHVERYDYQVTYGLSDKTPQGSPRFELDLDSEFEIKCNDDSSLIWSNLFKIMADDNQKNELFKKGNKQIMFDFLEQFYIVDLCHFAPQDKAKAINDVKDWDKIRFKVASHYLTKEIDIIKPKVIITQGNGVFNELKKILKIKETKSYPLKFGKNTWSVKTGINSNNNIKVLSIPHFGTILNYKTFYQNNRDLVTKTLSDNNLI